MIKVATNLTNMCQQKASKDLSFEDGSLVPLANLTSSQPLNYLASGGIGALLGGTVGAGARAAKGLIEGEEDVPEEDLLKYILAGAGIGGAGGLGAKAILDKRSPYLSPWVRSIRHYNGY